MSRILVFMPDLAGGGAERVTLELCRGLVQEGHEVRLALVAESGELSGSHVDGLLVTELSATRVATALGPLARYIKECEPDLVVSVLSHANIIAAFAVRLSCTRVPLIVMHHNTMSISVRASSRRRDRLIPLMCAVAYRLADRICAVSDGVAQDLAESSHLALGRIDVLPNPIDYAKIAACGCEAVPHGILPAGAGPLIVSAGRLEAQKDFGGLIAAFSLLPSDHRLVILGEGTERASLAAKVTELGLSERVSLPGFIGNPYPIFACADVFVLSSRWEGLPTVLLEAATFDLKIVSTDCRSGPREILRDGEYGALVPVGDVAALASAMRTAIQAENPSLGDLRAEYDFPSVCKRFSDLVDEVLV